MSDSNVDTVSRNKTEIRLLAGEEGQPGMGWMRPQNYAVDLEPLCPAQGAESVPSPCLPCSHLSSHRSLECVQLVKTFVPYVEHGQFVMHNTTRES